MVRHTDGENATYWAEQTEAWFGENVHGKEVDEFVAIAGDAVVELADEWLESHAEAARDGLLDAGFPPVRIEDRRDGGLRLRVDANDDRLPMPYGGV